MRRSANPSSIAITDRQAVADILTAVKDAKSWSWDELAAKLEVSRTHLLRLTEQELPQVKASTFGRIAAGLLRLGLDDAHAKLFRAVITESGFDVYEENYQPWLRHQFDRFAHPPTEFLAVQVEEGTSAETLRRGEYEGDLYLTTVLDEDLELEDSGVAPTRCGGIALTGLGGLRYFAFHELWEFLKTTPAAETIGRFSAWAIERGHSEERIELAFVRALEPLLQANDSGFMELGWRELRVRPGGLDELVAFVRHSLERERILLSREPDVTRLQDLLLRMTPLVNGPIDLERRGVTDAPAPIDVPRVSFADRVDTVEEGSGYR
jgi:transcriptional regulator with XRE-family HTH domain